MRQKGKDLRDYTELARIVFTRSSGVKFKKFVLSEFKIPIYFTKSKIVAANVRFQAEQTVEGVPSPIIIKDYGQRPELVRLSEEEATANDEFRREQTVLSLNIASKLPWNGSEELRVYPKYYSGGVPECEKERVIIREFIPGETLEQLAGQRRIEWIAPAGTPAASNFLIPLSILHAKSSEVADALDREGLLRYGTPENASPEGIANKRAELFVRYVGILVGGLGKKLDNIEAVELHRAFWELDKEYVSRKELLSIVDGELDVFPHHAMLNRIPDAGGVDVGGIARDLAVFGSPCLEYLWKDVEKMPEEVLKVYTNIRSQLEDVFKYGGGNIEKIQKVVSLDELRLGVLLAAGCGNTRKAAAILYYRGGDPSIPQEINPLLNQAYRDFLAVYNGVLKIAPHRKHVNTIMSVFNKYELRADAYNLPVKKGIDSPINRREVLGKMGELFDCPTAKKGFRPRRELAS